MSSCAARSPTPTWESGRQRVGILEESEPKALDKMHAAGLRTLAYFETFGQAKAFVVQLRKNPDGTWMKDKLDPQLTRRFLNHWGWDRFDGTGEIRWAGSHNYFGDEDFARPYTLTHPRYGSPPVRYPDGTIATGYQGPDNRSAQQPRLRRLRVQGRQRQAVYRLRLQPRSPAPRRTLTTVCCKSARNMPARSTSAKMPPVPPGSTTRAPPCCRPLTTVSTACGPTIFRPGTVSASIRCTRPSASGRWPPSATTSPRISPRRLAAMGVRDLKSFDVRAYLRAKAAEWGGYARTI